MRPLWLIAFTLLLASPAWSVVGVGESAPDFTLTSLYDGDVTLSAHQGEVVQVWFFGWW